MAGQQQARFITLPDGRRLAYLLLGCTDGTAQRSLVALHGIMSSRLGAVPGISEETLRDYGVRLVTVDRPGYGQSDCHRSLTLRSFCQDLEALIDLLDLGKKIWLLGFSMGGAFTWAAARYIPGRIAGIALWCPVGNFWWKGISKKERKAMMASYSTSDRLFYSISQQVPFLAFKLYAKWLSERMARGPSKNLKSSLSPRDWECIQQPELQEHVTRDYNESSSRSKGYGLAKDLQVMTGKWGFEINEVGEVFNGHIHIWQGDKDNLVPLALQKWIKKQLPQIVHLHELPGEGHLSWLFFNDAAHRETLAAIFEEQEEIKVDNIAGEAGVPKQRGGMWGRCIGKM
eukprot:c23153_g2_i2 orf=125-1156(+)